MKKVFLLFLITFGASTCLSKYGGGSGDPNAPYLICDANQMNQIGAETGDLDKHFVLMNDIDLGVYSNNDYNIIGHTYPGTFEGFFDGNGHTIRNLILDVNTSMVGLFGWIGSSGLVQNVYLEGVDINAISSVGGIAGRNEGVIQNCHVRGTIRGEQSCGGITGFCGSPIWGTTSIKNCSFTGQVLGMIMTGGIVGSTDGPEVLNCYAIVEIIGNGQCGGIVGHNMGGNFQSCFAKGNIICTHSSAGGFAGLTYDHCGYGGIIRDCYADITVNCSRYAGGFSGSFPGAYGMILNCYSCGEVIYDSYSYVNVGGFIGDDRPLSNVYNCFFLETAGPDTGSGEPLTVEQMKQQTSFAGWDFDYDDGNDVIWFMPADGYPILTWQISPVDIYTDGRNDMKDFAVLASYWMRDNCGIYNSYCNWADLDFSGVVGIDDLVVLMNYWLKEGIYD